MYLLIHRFIIDFYCFFTLLNKIFFKSIFTDLANFLMIGIVMKILFEHTLTIKVII